MSRSGGRRNIETRYRSHFLIGLSYLYRRYVPKYCCNSEEFVVKTFTMFSVVCFRYKWLFYILATNQLSKVVLILLT